MLEYNRRFSDTDPCWLVKVDTRITGPFSFNEVLSKLTSGELHPYNEVISPMDRWRPLQSHPLFAAAVEKMKKLNQDAPEYTFTKTERTSFTRTLDLNVDRQTPTPSRDNTITPPPAFEPTPAPLSVHRPAPSAPPLYPGTPNSTKKTSLLPTIVLVAMAVACAAAYFLLTSKKTGSVSPQNRSKSEFFVFYDRGLANKKTGDFYEALKNFKQAHQQNAKDQDLVFEMAPLLIQVEGQTMYARSILEKAMVGQYKEENIFLGRNVIGLSYSYEAPNSSALKAALKNFEESINVAGEHNYYPAMINKGFAYMLMGKYGEAESLLAKSVNAQNLSNLPILYLLESYIIEGYKNNNKRSFEKAFQISSQIQSRRLYDGQQELLLFHAYLSQKTGQDIATVLGTLQRSLMIDPDQTSDHVHSPILDWRGLNWKNFSFICKDLAQVAKQDMASLLDFVCTYKARGEIEAQRATDGWISRSQASATAHTARAIISYKLGEFEKAKDSLALANKLGAQDKLYYQILMKVCIQLQDSSCIKQTSDILTKQAPLHASLGRVELLNSSLEKKQEVYKGLRESPNYIPLVKQQ